MAACVAGSLALGHDDLQVQGRALGPLLVEELDGRDAVHAGREAVDVGRAHPQVAERAGEQEQGRDGHDAQHRRSANDDATILAQTPAPSARSRPRNGMRPRLTRSPRIESVAGRKVRLPITATSTTPIIATAIALSVSTRIRNRPAERHGDGEAAEEDGSAGRPGRRLDRGELGLVRAPLAPEAGDHEQRVVHADGQADEDDQLARAHRHRSDELAVDAQDAKAGEQGREGQDERHRRRDRGAEGDEQDQEGGRKGDLERAIQVVANDLHHVFHDQRVVERVDLEARVVRGKAGEDRTEGRGLGRDGIRVALDRGDDPDGRSICRHEAGLRAERHTDPSGWRGRAGRNHRSRRPVDRSCRRRRCGRPGPWRDGRHSRTTR